jgi:hypothetical protein
MSCSSNRIFFLKEDSNLVLLNNDLEEEIEYPLLATSIFQ